MCPQVEELSRRDRRTEEEEEEEETREARDKVGPRLHSRPSDRSQAALCCSPLVVYVHIHVYIHLIFMLLYFGI